jgi:hypothetical protein
VLLVVWCCQQKKGTLTTALTGCLPANCTQQPPMRAQSTNARMQAQRLSSKIPSSENDQTVPVAAPNKAVQRASLSLSLKKLHRPAHRQKCSQSAASTTMPANNTDVRASTQARPPSVLQRDARSVHATTAAKPRPTDRNTRRSPTRRRPPPIQATVTITSGDQHATR